MKSKAKPVNIKSKPSTLIPKLSWWKASVLFKNPEQCRALSMPLAINLRMQHPLAYFARYMTAVESRTDYYFAIPLDAPLMSPASTANMLAHFQDHTFVVSKPIPCEGSTAHSMGLDLAIAIWTQHMARRIDNEDTNDEDAVKQTFELFADVMHWTANALGLDYCDEAKLHLYSMDRIVNIFSHSVKLGNKLTAAAKKATKRPGAPERN